jgi:hypothetical protein
MQVRSQSYLRAALWGTAFFSALSALSSISHNTAYAVILSTLSTLLAVGVLWEHSRAKDD